jgi:tetratricopeptide (TPR) repeat protein
MPKPDLRTSAANIAQAIEEAIAHFRQGRLAEADKICTRVLKVHSNHFDALHLAGIIKLQNGKAGAAYALIESALKVNPQAPEALANLGMALAALNRGEEALAAIDRALALLPDSFESLNNRGNVLLKLNRPADALAAFDRVSMLEPRHLGARINRGNALAALERFDEAVAQYDAVLAVHPTHAETHCNRGNALSGRGRYSDAIAAYDRALALRPDYVKALTNRGIALQTIGQHQEALAEFGKVLAIDKDHADAHHNEALTLLTLGDYRRGFAAYEWRWQRTGMPARRRSFGKPLWLGEYPLGRRTILLHAEQGLGDTIQFVRYAPLLAKTGANVVIEVPPELTDLLTRVAGVSGVVASGAPLPAFDVHCPMGSLPHALKTEPATIPADIPYLTASAEGIAKWRERIERLPSPRIAIAWSGRATHANDRNRSVALARLEPLLALDGASFVSIQRELRDADREVLARAPRLAHVGGDLDDFDDTAAVVSLVDLVISVDTSVVHLAAALGRPTWILLPFWPDWRWMLDRADSPWYPTVRLFRQRALGDWDGVIARVTEEVLKVAAAPLSHAGAVLLPDA